MLLLRLEFEKASHATLDQVAFEVNIRILIYNAVAKTSKRLMCGKA
jgi:hypothetical protein